MKNKSERTTQNFQCRVTPTEYLQLSNTIESFGFSTPRDFITSMSEILDSGEITGKLREYRYRKVNEQMKVCRNINKKH